MDSPPCEVCAIYIYMCVVYGVFYKGGACEAPPCETHAVYVWRIISQQTGSVLRCAMGYGAAAAAAALVVAMGIGSPPDITCALPARHISRTLHSGYHHAREPAREALLFARPLILISTTDLPTQVGRHSCTRSTLAIHCVEILSSERNRNAIYLARIISVFSQLMFLTV